MSDKKLCASILAHNCGERLRWTRDSAETIKEMGWLALGLLMSGISIGRRRRESLAKLEEVKKVVKGQAWNGTLVHRRADGSTFQATCAIVPLTRKPFSIDALAAPRAPADRISGCAGR